VSEWDWETIIGLQAIKFGEKKTQYNGSYAVQYHSKSLRLVPIESMYVTYY